MIQSLSRDQWQRGTKERSDDVFLGGGGLFLLTFRTPCSLYALVRGPAPRRSSRRHWLVGGLFFKGEWSLRTSITRDSTYLPNV